MSSNFTGSPNNFLPTTFFIPEEEDQRLIKLREYLGNIAQATNSKDSAIYDAIETITGQRFLPLYSNNTASNATYRSVSRIVLDFGALPAAGTKSVAHGITVSASTSITKIYGAATDPSTSFIPLPYSSPTLNENIALNMDSTNVNVVVGIDRSAFTRTFVIIEFMQVT